MSAFNLALMFAPHVMWPRHVRCIRHYENTSLFSDVTKQVLSFVPFVHQMSPADLKANMKKLNTSMAFLIKHSQKVFRVIIDTLPSGSTSDS